MTRTVLCIDDSATVRHYIEAAMRRKPDAAVLVAGTGQDGIRLARAHQPSLILLDGSLPDMRGIDVLRNLKDSTPTRGIPVVILSGSGEEENEPFAEAGADDYVVKPITLHELFALVDRYAPPPAAERP